jgi:NADH:ubiquinone oxidoreductase subunit D
MSPDQVELAEETTEETPDIHTEEFVVNMGPQHPSTHGVLRLELVMGLLISF